MFTMPGKAERDGYDPVSVLTNIWSSKRVKNKIDQKVNLAIIGVFPMHVSYKSGIFLQNSTSNALKPSKAAAAFILDFKI